MAYNELSQTKISHIARWIVGAATLGVLLLLAYGPESMSVALDNLLGMDFPRALGIFARIWVVSTPAGLLIGLLIGSLVSYNVWLSRSFIRLLRIGRWAPFLIYYYLIAVEVEVVRFPLNRYWFWTYGAITVALTACYEMLIARSLFELPFKSGLERVCRAAVLQGIFIALLLDMSAWIDLWVGYAGGKAPTGYKVFGLLAAAILLINWASGQSFERSAAGRGRVLIKELKYENGKSFLGASGLLLLCFILWQVWFALVGAPSSVSASPLDILSALRSLIFAGDLTRDAVVSFGEIFLGLVSSGAVGALLVLVMHRAGRGKAVIDRLIQATQIAPIALLPDMLGIAHFVFQVSQHTALWSTACVAMFALYPFARALEALSSESIVPRLLLAADEALPYGAAAIVYGEMMNATGGLGFMMTVAGATFQIDRAFAVFFTLLFLVAAFSALLRGIAKRTRHVPAPQESSLTPSSAAA